MQISTTSNLAVIAFWLFSLEGGSAIAACIDPDLDRVSKTTSLMLCDGTIASGRLVSPDLSMLQPQNLAAGTTIAGVVGQVVMPSACSDGGTGVGCVASSTFPAAAASHLTAGNIRSGVTIGGVTGNYPSATYPLITPAIAFTSEYCTTERRTNSPFANSGDAGAGASPATPFTICTLDQLDAMRTALSANFRLAANIDASPTKSSTAGAGWDPVGATKSAPFLGSFDGDGKTIDGLSIARPSTDNIGLFGVTCAYSSVWTECQSSHATFLKNVRFTHANINGSSDVGILAGIAFYNQISGVRVSGKVAGWQRVGGIVGQAGAADIANVGAEVVVSAIGSLVGGVAGNGENAHFTNCYATGRVLGGTGPTPFSSYVGGVVGQLGKGSVDKCLFVGSVVGSGLGIGGLIGTTALSGTASVSNSYAVAQITGREHLAGFIGIAMDVAITKSYAAGEVSAFISNGYVGGLVAKSQGTVSAQDSFYAGHVKGEQWLVNGMGVFTGLALSSSTNNFYSGANTNHGAVATLDQTPFAAAKPESYFYGLNSAANNGAGEIFNNWDFNNVWLARSGRLPALRCPAAFGAVLDCEDWNVAARTALQGGI